MDGARKSKAKAKMLSPLSQALQSFRSNPGLYMGMGRPSEHSQRQTQTAAPMENAALGRHFVRSRQRLDYSGFTIAVPEPTTIKWHFSQENATLHDARKGM